MPERNHDRIRLAVSLYGDGWTLERVGRHMGISKQRVSQLLHREGVAMRPYGGKNKKVLALTDAEICNAARAGVQPQALASAMGCSIATIYVRLSAARVQWHPRKSCRDLPVDRMQQDYAAGAGCIEIARRYGCSTMGAYYALRRVGTAFRHSGPKPAAALTN